MIADKSISLGPFSSGLVCFSIVNYIIFLNTQQSNSSKEIILKECPYFEHGFDDWFCFNAWLSYLGEYAWYVLVVCVIGISPRFCCWRFGYLLYFLWQRVIIAYSCVVILIPILLFIVISLFLIVWVSDAIFFLVDCGNTACSHCVLVCWIFMLSNIWCLNSQSTIHKKNYAINKKTHSTMARKKPAGRQAPAPAQKRHKHNQGSGNHGSASSLVSHCGGHGKGNPE